MQIKTEKKELELLEVLATKCIKIAKLQDLETANTLIKEVNNAYNLFAPTTKDTEAMERVKNILTQGESDIQQRKPAPINKDRELYLSLGLRPTQKQVYKNPVDEEQELLDFLDIRLQINEFISRTLERKAMTESMSKAKIFYQNNNVNSDPSDDTKYQSTSFGMY